MATVPELQLPDVEAMTAEEALLWAYEQFGDRMCLTCSWQRQSSVLVHMVFGELGLDVPVVELDTEVLFPETYATRDRSAGVPAASPSTRTAPPATTCTPTIARISVVLPEPLGPSRPVTAPAATFTETSSMTTLPPRTTRSSSISTAGTSRA